MRGNRHDACRRFSQSTSIDRRSFLRAGLAAAAAPLVSGCSTPTPKGEWRNWSGGQVSHPKSWLSARDEDELVAGIRAAEGTVRVAGASHSFSPVCKTDGTLVSIDHLSGVVAHDAERLQATVWAGTRLRDLGEPLWKLGQGLMNQGDIDSQSVGGACGTSTHGTGVKLGSFSSVVCGVRLVTAEGDVVDADPERETALYQAARTSVGAVGILTQITLQNRGAYKLREQEYVEKLDDVLGKLDEYRTKNRHFEFWPFFGSDRALVKLLNETDAEPTPAALVSLPVDAAVWLAAEIAHGWTATDARMQRLLLDLHTDTERVGRSYQIFPSPRTTRFNEMEYEIPAERGPECLQEILATVRKKELNTLFPLEYRYVAADDAWLSPFYGRDTAAISVHQYHKVDYRPLFSVVEAIFRKYGGRPHWGKLHTLTAKELGELYPRWDDYELVRRHVDPKGRFLNDHLRSVFGENA